MKIKSGFKAPDDYFEKFEARILDKIPQNGSENAIPETLQGTLFELRRKTSIE